MPCFSKFYYMLGVSFFPTSFKLANIRSVIQKGPKKSNKNYRYVSILVDVSKIHEKCLFNQMSSYFEKVCGQREDICYSSNRPAQSFWLSSMLSSLLKLMLTASVCHLQCHVQIFVELKAKTKDKLCLKLWRRNYIWHLIRFNTRTTFV